MAAPDKPTLGSPYDDTAGGTTPLRMRDGIEALRLNIVAVLDYGARILSHLTSEDAAMKERIAALETRMAALEGRVAILEARP